MPGPAVVGSAKLPAPDRIHSPSSYSSGSSSSWQQQPRHCNAGAFAPARARGTARSLDVARMARRVGRPGGTMPPVLRKPARAILNVLTALSLALCVAVLVMCVRSYWVHDNLLHRRAVVVRTGG